MTRMRLRASDCLRKFKMTIIEHWRNRAQCEVDAAKFQEKLVLLDSLPDFLDDIANTLDPKVAQQQSCESSDVCEKHGEQRAVLPQYSLPQVLVEYSILRQELFEFLETECTITKTERNAVLTAIERGMQRAAEAFAEIRTNDLRTERDESRHHREVAEHELRTLANDKEAQQNFVSTLTHDLRNPIGSAKMAMDLLLPYLERTEDAQELIDLVFRNLDKAEKMLHDLLDAHRIKAGQPLPLTVERCNLTQLVSRILLDLESFHGKRFVLEADGEFIGYWSASNLERVVENLVGVALKYGDATKPITLKLFQTDDLVTLIVHNCGTPIPLREQATVFDFLYRAKTAQGGPQTGWGLGLTLVRGVVEALGGKVEVSSSLAEGTTFAVVLPLDSRPFQAF